MEAIITSVKNNVIRFVPSFPPLTILEDEYKNRYLTLVSHSNIDDAVVEYAYASGGNVEKMLKIIHGEGGEISVIKDYGVAVLIGDMAEFPKAGIRVRRLGSFREIKGPYAAVTPFGKYEPFKRHVAGREVFQPRQMLLLAMTGMGKSALRLSIIYDLLEKKRSGEIPPEYGDLKVVVLDYHNEDEEAAEDFEKLLGTKVLYLKRPFINLCSAPPETLAAIFGILPVADKAHKMLHYMHLISQLACGAPPELKAKYKDPVDLIIAIMEVIALLPYFHKVCKQGSLIESREGGLCDVYEYIKSSMPPFRLNMYLELLEERDADSVLSLVRYGVNELSKYRGMITLGEDINFDDYDIIFVNLSIALSNTSYAIPISIYLISRVMASPYTIILFIEEAPALLQNDYIRNAVENTVRQGRKFGKFVFLVSQEPLGISAQTELIVGRIASSKYIENVLARVPNMSSALASILPMLQPWEFLHIGYTVIPVKLTQKVVRHRASEL